MPKELDAILCEWKFCRNNTIDFIHGINDGELDMKLPRRGLDTFRKHFIEMLNVQEAYIRGIETEKMSFEDTAESLSLDSSVETILRRIEVLENRMLEVISHADENCQIDWFGEKKTLCGHLCALCTHEAMHIGQMVAFSYVKNVPIPHGVVQDWDLPE